MNGQKAGADAVIIVDDRDEPLLTPDAANDEGTGSYVDNITIPAALARKVDGSKFEAEIARNERVMGTMDWHDVLPHPMNASNGNFGRRRTTNADTHVSNRTHSCVTLNRSRRA